MRRASSQAIAPLSCRRESAEPTPPDRVGLGTGRARDRKVTVMPNVGPMELVVLLVIALLVLGPRRLPSAGRSLGQGIREFKSSLTGEPEKPEVEESTRA